jgi:hypothetical protein
MQTLQADRIRRLTMTSLALAAAAAMQVVSAAQPGFWIYGFIQADSISDFNRVDPDWIDTLPPSKIPTIDGIHGADGQSLIGVRQSRFGVQVTVPLDAAGNSVRARKTITDIVDALGANPYAVIPVTGGWVRDQSDWRQHAAANPIRAPLYPLNGAEKFRVNKSLARTRSMLPA